MKISNRRWIFTVSVLLLLILSIVWFCWNLNPSSSKINQSTEQVSELYTLDSLLVKKEYDLYVWQLKRKQNNALATGDTTAFLKAGIKLMFAYIEILPNEDSLKSVYQIVKPWAFDFSEQKYRYNAEFRWASYLVDKGRYTEAMTILHRIGPIIEAAKYDFLPHYYDTMAKLYYNLGDNKKAFELLKKELALFEDKGALINLSSTYNNLGVLYKNEGNVDSSLHYHQKSIKISKDLKDSSSIAKSYNNIGSLYLEQNKMFDALKYFELAFKTNPQYPTSSTLTNYSQLLFLTGKEMEAEKMLREIAENGMLLSNRLQAYERLKAYKEGKGQYREALEIAKTINKIEKEHLDETKIKELEKLKAKYELEAKENLINQLQEKEALQSLIARQRGVLAVALLALCLLLVAFGVGWFKNMKYKAARQQLILEQRLLRSQMNPHFIFNVLTNIQNTVMENHPLHAALSISRFAKLIRQNFDFIQKEYISLEEELDALKNYVDTQKMRFQNKFEYTCTLDLQDPAGELNIPPLLLQPLIENAIEHGFKGIETQGNIVLHIKQTDVDTLKFDISDNGIGYQPTEQKEIHALDILKTRLRINNPKDEKSFEIKKRIPSGTQVSFSLTLKTV